MTRRAVMNVGVSVAALVLSVGTAAGQQQPSQPQPSGSPAMQGAQQPGQAPVELDVSSLVGSKVRSKDGRDVGSVDRVMIDPKDGRLTSVVIKMGGTLGMGGRTLAVPWQSVQVGREGQDVIVSLDAQLLQEAPPRAGERQQQPAASPGQGQPPASQQPPSPPRQQ